MLLIQCPYCGLRPELEFAYAGQAHVARPADPSATTPDQWTAKEAGFIAGANIEEFTTADTPQKARALVQRGLILRDTTTDQFLATYRAGEPMPVLQAGQKP